MKINKKKSQAKPWQSIQKNVLWDLQYFVRTTNALLYAEIVSTFMYGNQDAYSQMNRVTLNERWQNIVNQQSHLIPGKGVS